jgi:hypothetical protein
VAGGFERDGVWHDSHAHPVPEPVLDILSDLASRVTPPGVLLERDEDFPAPEELERELDAIRERVTASGELPAAPSDARELTAALSEARVDSLPASPAARERTALAQVSLLSALVAGTPAPEGFDHARLRVQSRALTAKRADVVAKVAPELPEIIGTTYRADFFSYAKYRPMTGGYRHDALGFAEHLLLAGQPENAEARGRLTQWWLERSGPAPLDAGPVTRWLRAARFALRRG